MAPRAGLIVRLPRAGRLLDSIVRGRAWIPVLGVLLVGIVGMRVEVLKLGSSVGAEMQQASVLQSANAVMQTRFSALSNSQAIEQQAEKLGMTMPLPLDIHFVHASGPASVSRAIADVREPSPSSFLAGLNNERVQDGASVATAENTSAIGVLGGGAISDGASTSAGTSQTGITPTDAPADTAPGDTAVAGAPATQAGPSGSTGDSPGTGASDTASTDSGTSDSVSGNAGGTDNVAPVTNTASDGAASLAG